MTTIDARISTSDPPSHAAAAQPFDPIIFIEAAPPLPRSPWCAQPRVSPAQARAEQLGEAIAELSARIQAATYELLVLIREFDAGAGWNTGFCSCAHWLNWRTGLDLGAAREKVRVARALAELPLLSAALERGQISYSKVRALTRVATAENERSLLDFARCGTAAHVERLVRGWRRVDRVAEARDERRRHETRELRTWVDADGMVVIRGRLSPEVGAVVQRALEAASERLYKETAGTDPGASETTAGQRRADALGLLAETALAADLDHGTAGDRYQVVVHVDDGVLEDDEATGQSALEDGPYVSAETSRRLACDAAKVVMRHGSDGQALDVGRKTRTVPPALRRALTTRDRRCRFPGCSSRHCDAHHVRHWAQGGSTNLGNLLLLCRRHHRAVHEEGFAVTLGVDGVPHFRWPDGRPLLASPPPPRWSGPPLAPTNEHLDASGFTIDAHTATPHWHGERPRSRVRHRCDVAAAVDRARPSPLTCPPLLGCGVCNRAIHVARTTVSAGVTRSLPRPAYPASGTSRERFSCRSRVSSGTRCTTLVAAISSSAASPLKSRVRMARQTSKVIGQTCSRDSSRVSSGESRSTSIRPSCSSFAISHSAIAEMLHESDSSNRRSLAVSRPANA